MNLLKLNLHHLPLLHRRRCHPQPKLSMSSFSPREQNFKVSSSFPTPVLSFSKYAKNLKVNAATPFSVQKNEEGEFEEYLAEDGDVYQKTLRLVECAMFAAVSGAAFLLSNSLAIEKYFACFFALPIVLSTMRWGVAAGRKTMVATVVLLFTLAGPVKASTYLLLHGFLGLAIGTLWRLKTSWGVSIFLCSIIRATGALSNVVIASYLIGENILALITINTQALLTNIFSAMGMVVAPSMNLIYFVFGILLLLNCGFFVFLLHILYAIYFTRTGMKSQLRVPKWLESAI